MQETRGLDSWSNLPGDVKDQEEEPGWKFKYQSYLESYRNIFKYTKSAK